MNNPNVLGVYSKISDISKDKLQTLDVPQKFHTTQETEFIKMLCGEICDIFPTVKDGLRSQKILDAILESSEKRCWIDI